MCVEEDKFHIWEVKEKKLGKVDLFLVQDTVKRRERKKKGKERRALKVGK